MPIVALVALLATLQSISRDRDEPGAKATTLPRLVLVTMDTTRADHLGCYGYPRGTTPQIDAIAAQSVVFENCQSAFTVTTPSHASILTGTYPLEHGVT